VAKVVGRYGGIYVTHLRSEGDHLLEAIGEDRRRHYECSAAVRDRCRGLHLYVARRDKGDGIGDGCAGGCNDYQDAAGARDDAVVGEMELVAARETAAVKTGGVRSDRRLKEQQPGSGPREKCR